jgi:hypothetical protein
VNYLRSAYNAIGVDTTAVRTCYFSAIYDFRTVYTYVHWANVEVDGRVCYEMDRIGAGCFVEDAESLKLFYRLIQNLQDHAVRERLADLKAIVPKLTTEVVQALKVAVEVAFVSVSSSGEKDGLLRLGRRRVLLMWIYLCDRHHIMEGESSRKTE